MRFSRRNTSVALMAAALAFVERASAHTWVEQLMRIAPNGTMVGEPGFPPRVRLRGEPGFDETALVTLIPRDTPRLWSKTPFTQENPDRFPMLKAAPGDFVALRYQENGHVSLPQNNKNKPANRGTVYVYATSEPRESDTLFDVHKKWTADGTGGDGRGKLLATRNYDDGQCYQINGQDISTQRQQQFKKESQALQGRDLWCQSDIQLPADMATDKPLAVYWIWDWPNLVDEADIIASTKDGIYGVFPENGSGSPEGAYLEDKNVAGAETYVSVLLIDPVGVQALGDGEQQLASIVDGDQAAVKVANFLESQDLNNAAVLEQLETPFLIRVEAGETGGVPGPKFPNATTTAVPNPTAPAGDGIKTVTVTADPTTVTTIVTVTVGRDGAAPTDAPESGNGDGQGDGKGRGRGGRGGGRGRPTSVTPFVKPRATGLRARGAWHFGA